MKVFRKYEKTYRIEMPGYPIKGKYHLAKKVEEKLFKGECLITEKTDGANTGIFKKDGKISLQKKGDIVDYSHPQFSYFQNEWYFNNIEKIKKLPDNIVVYGELLRCVHTVYYDKLSDWWLVFDIYDLKQKNYLEWEEVVKICKTAGLHTVPLIYKGKLKKDDLLKYVPTVSKFGDIAEGIVVKNYEQQVRGKFVKPEFIKAIDNDTFWRNRKIKLNKVI